MTGFDLAKGLPLAAVLILGVNPVCLAQPADRTVYAAPDGPVKLSAHAAATLAGARTAALVVVDASRLEFVSLNEAEKKVIVVRHGGIRRAVSEEKAREELMASMRDWNRFSIVGDAANADVVVVLFEDTVEPSAFTRATGDRKHRLRERLAVYTADRPDAPLWANEFRESTVNALTASPVEKVVEKLRDELTRALK